MSAAPAPDLRRVLALLADRALQGLGRRDAEELRELLAAIPDLDERVLDRAAAQIDAALAPAPEEALPTALRRALLQDLAALWKGEQPEAEADDVEAEPAPLALVETRADEPADAPADAAAPEPLVLGLDPEPEHAGVGFALELGASAEIDAPAPRPRRPVRSLRARRGSSGLLWLAVVCLALVFIGLRLRGGAETSGAELAQAPDALHLAWRPGSAAGPPAAGDLLWSDERQLGLTRLRGLPANDPSRSRYQLWIVDSERGGQAVPAGLFDVAADADEVEVEIRPALPVARPLRFAITQEKPGGVLTSRFDRTVAISRASDVAPPVGAAPR